MTRYSRVFKMCVEETVTRRSESMGMHVFMRSPQDYWSCCFSVWVPAPYSRPSGRDGFCNISDLAPYSTQHDFTLCQFCYTSMHMIGTKKLTLYIFREHIQRDVPKFRGDLPCFYAYYCFFFCFCSFCFSYFSGILQITFLTNVFRKKIFQQTVSLLAILQ